MNKLLNQRNELPLTPQEAARSVHDGSAIVVVPYTSYMQPDGSVRLSTYTEIAAHAAAELYHDAGQPDTQVIAVGEHTYGTHNTSTTSLMYDDLLFRGVPKGAIGGLHPLEADTTPQQIAWLAAAYGATWQSQPPVLVGHASHWPRIRLLCDVYGLPSRFVDAATMLELAGKLTPAYRQAIEVYNTEGRRYEEQVHRLTAATAWFGPAVLTAIFKVLVRLRSPNVVDVHDGRLYASTARKHTKHIRR